MKTCHCGNTYKPVSNDRCCPHCRASKLKSSCEQCGVLFQKSRLGSTERFCSQSCAARWRLSQPDIRAKFYTNQRQNKINATKAELFKNYPERYRAMRKAMSEGAERFLNSLTPEQRLARNRAQSVLLKRIGHKPRIRGGNGTGPTRAETALLEMFPGSNPRNNYPIKTGMKNGSGYPTCYKLDVAFPELKFGIEADGNSHCANGRKEQDAKKVDFLSKLGWLIIRIRNKRILESPREVKAEIASIISRLRNESHATKT